MADRRLEMVNENFVSTTPTSTTVWFYFRWKKSVLHAASQPDTVDRLTRFTLTQAFIVVITIVRSPKKKDLMLAWLCTPFARAHTHLEPHSWWWDVCTGASGEKNPIWATIICREALENAATHHLSSVGGLDALQCVYFLSVKTSLHSVSSYFFFFFLEKSQLNFWPSPALTSQTVSQPRFSRQRQRFCS